MKNDAGDLVKLSVFVGSPKRDLGEVRGSIIQAVLEAGHVPDGMELWAADPRPTLQTIGAKLRGCDVHVVVLGSNYGSIIENLGVSFTQWEYEESRKANRPIIAFLLDEKAVAEKWEQTKPTEQEKANYREFRKKLCDKSVCKIYADHEMATIASDVKQALNEVLDSGELPHAAGWVRAESKAAQLATALQGNAFLMRIMGRIVGFQTTGSRFDTEPDAKRAASKTFWFWMFNELNREGYKKIFIESGSSLGYVSEALEKMKGRNHGFTVSTNNALSLLQLLLFTDGDIRRNPPVAPNPEDPYGAIFTENCVGAYEEPPTRPRPLYEKESNAVTEIVSLLMADKGKHIILATASGWDTRHRVKGFQGPHVGSHPNMLFKRAIFLTGFPVVLFLSLHKVDPRHPESGFKCRIYQDKSDANTRYCYPVFGKELKLADAVRSVPLALCVGYELANGNSKHEVNRMEARIRKVLGTHLPQSEFDYQYAAKSFPGDGGPASGAMIIANRKFRQLFPLLNV
jgi:hypothetical protein